jgi:hypothetical protein
MVRDVIVDAVMMPQGRRRRRFQRDPPGRPRGGRGRWIGESQSRRALGRRGCQFWGCAAQGGEPSRNLVRTTGLAAGWPDSVPGMTTNRACGASQLAVHLGIAVILAGLRDWLILGGIRWAALLDRVFASRPRCSPTSWRPSSVSSDACDPPSPTIRRTRARTAELITKTNPILGLGETTDEVVDDLADLHSAGCDLLTITQYLPPSPSHHPVERWVLLSELEQDARDRDFAGVRTGPTVRACHRTSRLYAAVMASNRRSHHPAGS